MSIIIKLQWWLWNQMFQYAYVKALSLRNKQDFKLDFFEYKTYFRPYELEIFDIEKNYASKKQTPFYENLYSKNKYIWYLLTKFKNICKKLNKKDYIEKQFNFDSDFFNIKFWYIQWYFQTEKYFIDFENEIRKNFEFIIPPSKKNQKTIQIINNYNSVSIHIRRWDYVTNPKANNVHWTCSLAYYQKAIEVIKTKINNPVFFIFSDDIKWVKDNLKIEKAYYIDWNNADKNYEDMRLMSLCKHNIIANSSFSWWGAWLNKNQEKIVIAPNKRFNDNKKNYCDIVPQKWIKI